MEVLLVLLFVVSVFGFAMSIKDDGKP